MEIDQEIHSGAFTIIEGMKNNSRNDTPMAMAQLLMAAAILARLVGMSRKTFEQGVSHAWHDANILTRSTQRHNA